MSGSAMTIVHAGCGCCPPGQCFHYTLLFTFVGRQPTAPQEIVSAAIQKNTHQLPPTPPPLQARGPCRNPLCVGCPGFRTTSFQVNSPGMTICALCGHYYISHDVTHGHGSCQSGAPPTVVLGKGLCIIGPLVPPLAFLLLEASTIHPGGGRQVQTTFAGVEINLLRNFTQL
ncbi:hypothetical protein B0H17DRAFT_1136335 [Mycena rosella]|uniref:GATA-type domain-containing protein n=1 Tax=Mycena rosella TaxID=1033263 RepID=A0AAD7GC42_MYCRO|nr:hypothetical protein B0H17DRAFT_1136335 [Mycena rosella]